MKVHLSVDLDTVLPEDAKWLEAITQFVNGGGDAPVPVFVDRPWSTESEVYQKWWDDLANRTSPSHAREAYFQTRDAAPSVTPFSMPNLVPPSNGPSDMEVDIGAQRDALERIIQQARTAVAMKESTLSERFYYLLAKASFTQDLNEYIDMAGGLHKAVQACWTSGQAVSPEQQAQNDLQASQLASDFLARYSQSGNTPLPFSWTRALPPTEISLEIT